MANYTIDDKGLTTVGFNMVDVATDDDGKTTASVVSNTVVFGYPINIRDNDDAKNHFASQFHKVVLERANVELANIKGTIKQAFDDERETKDAYKAITALCDKAISDNNKMISSTEKADALINTWVVLTCGGDITKSATSVFGDKEAVKTFANAIKAYSKADASKKTDMRKTFTEYIAPLFDARIEDFKIKDGKVTPTIMDNVTKAITGRAVTRKASATKGIVCLNVGDKFVIEQLVLGVLENRFAFPKTANKGSKFKKDVYKF